LNIKFLFSLDPADFAEFSKGSFEVFDRSTRSTGPGSGPSRAKPVEGDDFLGDNIQIGEVVGCFAAFVSKPKDVEAGFVAVSSEV
jgi:hypothetical protein